MVPIVKDEAYYLEWSKALDWGYYDHPPLIAWVNVLTALKPGSALLGRLGTILFSALAFPFMMGLLRRAGLTEPRAYLAGLLLFSFNLYLLAAGMLTTPDAVMITAWCAALHEAAAALAGDRRRWVTAGIAVGIGLLGKYVMVLIGPVFLWALLRGDPRALRTPWPYVGGVVALLVFSPHLAWNASNEWVPMRMQVQHGLEGGHDPGFTAVSDLPRPSRPQADGPEVQLAQYFVSVAKKRAAETKDVDVAPPKRQTPWPVLLLQRLAEYVGAMLVMWGAFLAPLLHRFIARLSGRLPPEQALVAPVRPLIVAATWVPLVFFAVITLMERVEANWAAIYTVGGAVLLAGFGASRIVPMIICSAINLVLLLVLVVYAYAPLTMLGNNRILDETYGWSPLAEYVAQLDGPVFVDREQRTSMIRFHRPEVGAVQWPGMTQPSEYIRRAEFQPWTAEALREQGAFWLVKDDPPLPPKLKGFRPVEMLELRVCLDQDLVVTEISDEPFQPACSEGQTVQLWYVIRYEAD